MAKIKDIEYNENDVPASWRYCFCEECDRHEDCLRFQTGWQVPEDRTWGNAVFPTAYRRGECPHFKEIRRIHAAYGMDTLYVDVKHKDFADIRDKIKGYLGGHSTYYRYNRGERLLTPEQQEWILRLFARYGYTENLSFAHYCNVLDLS